MAVELGALFVLHVIASSIFDKFEAETPAWRKMAKWALVAALTLGGSAFIGHWSLLVLFGCAGLGVTVHWIWCARNGIDPIMATPRRRYYTLRGWTWPEA